MLTRKHLSRARKPGLNLIGNQQNAMFPACVSQNLKKLDRCGDESAFSENGFKDDRGHRFSRDHTAENIFQSTSALHTALRIFKGVRAAITIAKRDAIYVARER